MVEMVEQYAMYKCPHCKLWEVDEIGELDARTQIATGEDIGKVLDVLKKYIEKKGE